MLLSASGAAAAMPQPSLAATPPRPTNVVIINLDDVGYGDFSANGAFGYKTPNIDRMIAEGMKFTHFLAVQPISGASRAGLLTGCYPNRFGFRGAPGPNSPTGIHQNEMTLGELVGQKGYATAIFGKWHLGDAFQFLPLQNGFDEYYGLPYSNDMWTYNPYNTKHPPLPTIEGNEAVGYDTDQSRFTTDYTDHATDFIVRNRKKPFLLYVAHTMAHVPLAVSDKFKGKSEQGMYGDVMMEIDWSVGRILETLREAGIEENTMVVLTSDNGPWLNYGNHAGSAGGLREAKASTFEGGNRVPCVFYWKGRIAPGSVCNRLASNIDLFPTVAELTGAPLPGHKIDGVSLVPLLDGDPVAQPRKTFVHYYGSNDLEAVTADNFKLVFPHIYQTHEPHLPGNNGVRGERTPVELKEMLLYDLRRDPGERYNVISQYPEVRAKLEAIADRARADLGDDLRGIECSNCRPIGRRDQ
jgi:arylsulfatase